MRVAEQQWARVARRGAVLARGTRPSAGARARRRGRGAQCAAKARPPATGASAGTRGQGHGPNVRQKQAGVAMGRSSTYWYVYTGARTSSGTAATTTKSRGVEGVLEEELTTVPMESTGRPEVDRSRGKGHRSPVMYATKMRPMASGQGGCARFDARDGRGGPWRFFWAPSCGARSAVAAALTTT